MDAGTEKGRLDYEDLGPLTTGDIKYLSQRSKHRMMQILFSWYGKEGAIVAFEELRSYYETNNNTITFRNS